jgi:predicted N-formylglutamate amidohydrolase
MTGRLSRNKALLLVCDIQDKFAPKSYGNLGVVEASSMMTRVAKIFNIPVLITEHNKKVFGETVP